MTLRPRLAFVDIETTGLDPDRHEIWEVGLITEGGSDDRIDVNVCWQFEIDEAAADPRALDIGHYWERRWMFYDSSHGKTDFSGKTDPRPKLPVPLDGGTGASPGTLIQRSDFGHWARWFRDLVGTGHLIGAVPSFDEERLRRFLLAYGILPRWHYQPIDVEALAVGYLRGRHVGMTVGVNDNVTTPPWDSNELSRAVGVEPDDYARHTALGDAQWARAIYKKVTGTYGVG